MDIRIYIHILLLAIILVGCTVLPVAEQPQAAPASGSVTLLDENGNRIVLETYPNNHALIQVFSEQGRGSTNISIASATYPSSITLRFHLRGLEDLSIRHGNKTHRVSLSSIANGGGSGNIAIQQSINDAVDENVLDPDAPEWLAIGMVDNTVVDNNVLDAAAQTTIPLENGYIDVTLPPSFTTEQIREFTIQWIDFYR